VTVAVVALSKISDIQMGYSFRAGLEPKLSGPVGVIQMKDLRDDHVVDLGGLTRTDMDVRVESRARQNDIVFRSRGDRATCAIVAADPGHAIVAAPLLRIRVTDDRVLPAYLNWYINQASAQAHLGRQAEGSYVKMISKRALGGLEVEVPSLDRQRGIAELAVLSNRARRLDARVSALRERMLADVMMTFARRTTND
jgi:hypothetical protein